MGISARYLALLLPLALAGCLTDGDDSGRSFSFTSDRGVADQPFPGNYHTEILAFMKTYLNNPVGLHDTAMAEPVQRTVGGRLRYVSCLRYAVREARRQLSRAAASTPSFMSMGGSTMSSKTPASFVPAQTYAPSPELAAMVR